MTHRSSLAWLLASLPLATLAPACGGSEGTPPNEVGNGAHGGSGNATGQSGTGGPRSGTASGGAPGAGMSGMAGASGTGGAGGAPEVGACPSPTSPIGWASVSGDGVSATTGGLGGDTVKPTTADQLIEYAASEGPLVI